MKLSNRQLIEDIAAELAGANGPEPSATVDDLYTRLVSLGQTVSDSEPCSAVATEAEDLSILLNEALAEGAHGDVLPTAAAELQRIADEQRSALNPVHEVDTIRALLDEGEQLVHQIFGELAGATKDVLNGALDLLDQRPAPLLVAGDFNDGGKSGLNGDQQTIIFSAHYDRAGSESRHPGYHQPTDHVPTILPMDFLKDDGSPQS